MINPDTLSFDQWQALHQIDPRNFEARRQTELALAIARYAPLNPKLRLALMALESESADKSGAQRAELAMTALVKSLRLLHRKFDELDESLRQLRIGIDAVNQAFTET